MQDATDSQITRHTNHSHENLGSPPAVSPACDEPPACFDSGELFEYAWQAAMGKPVDPGLAAHLLKCNKCISEVVSIMDDMRFLTTLDRSDYKEERVPAFQILSGALVAWHNRFQVQWLPAFRDGVPAVIHSDIIPLGTDYVLLEIRSGDDLVLNLEAGGKKPDPILISLYKHNHVIDKLSLQSRISWNLNQLEPGDYRLEINTHKSVHFKIQE